MSTQNPRHVARVGNAESEHLGFYRSNGVDAFESTLCGLSNVFFPIVEKTTGVVSKRKRLPLCEDCARVLHDLDLLADDPPL